MRRYVLVWKVETDECGDSPSFDVRKMQACQEEISLVNPRGLGRCFPPVFKKESSRPPIPIKAPPIPTSENPIGTSLANAK